MQGNKGTTEIFEQGRLPIPADILDAGIGNLLCFTTFSCSLVSLPFCSLIPNPANFSFYLFVYFFNNTIMTTESTCTTLKERMVSGIP